MKNKVITIGEALIDFVPCNKGKALKDVEGFVKKPGGAPANVAVTVTKLGGKAVFLGKLGWDAFGDYLVDVLEKNDVDTSYIQRTKDANTALAFVTLTDDGERDFSFYRNPSADMLLEESEIDEDLFEKGDVLHFCSVDLIEAPVKYAHLKAIEYAKSKETLISFDPNVRLPLWPSEESCKQTIIDFLPHADILKVSEIELAFLTEEKNEDKAISKLKKRCKPNAILFVTKGADGVVAYVGKEKYQMNSYKVEVKDTTGAGDSFIGAVLYQLVNCYQKELTGDLGAVIVKVLAFASGVGALTTTKEGAISALPTLEEVTEFLGNI